MRQLDGALWMYLNMDCCPIIQDICNLGVQGGGIWELKNLTMIYKEVNSIVIHAPIIH
jgi:hypothetical protein